MVLVSIICLLWPFLLPNPAGSCDVGGFEPDNEGLFAIADSLGSGVSRIRLIGWGMTGRSAAGHDEPAGMVLEAAAYVLPEYDAEIEEYEKGAVRQAEAVIRKDCLEARFICQDGNISSSTYGSSERYILADISIINGADGNIPDKLTHIQGSLLDYLETNTESYGFSVTYGTTFQGRIETDEYERIQEYVFRKLGGRITEGIRNDSLLSVSGYSPRLGKSLETDNGPINLNIAFRYNSFEDMTYMWLGTPVIAAEY